MDSSMTGSLTTLTLLTVSAACSGATSPDDRVADARAVWDSTELTTYEYDFSQSCFCPLPAIGPVRVRVVDNVVVSASRISDGQPVPDNELVFFSTVDELFDRLEQSAKSDPEVFEVLFHDTLGYPTSANVDISFMIADEEYSFTASSLAESSM